MLSIHKAHTAIVLISTYFSNKLFVLLIKLTKNTMQNRAPMTLINRGCSFGVFKNHPVRKPARIIGSRHMTYKVNAMI
jgi:hypothetical protein